MTVSFESINSLPWSDFRGVLDVLDTLTYKPGWSWKYAVFDGDLMVFFEAPAIDTYSGNQSKFMSQQRVPRHLVQRDDIIEWVRWQLWEMEQHEMDEWIKDRSDPEPIFNPHNPDRSYELRMQRRFKAAEQRLNDKVKERRDERPNATAVA